MAALNVPLKPESTPSVYPATTVIPDLARVHVRLRTSHGRRTVTLVCAHGRTVHGEPSAVTDTTAGLIGAARDDHERDTGCDCLPRLAEALDPDR